MRAKRALGGLSTAALVFTFAGCGASSGDQVTATQSTAGTTEDVPAGTETPTAETVEGTIVDDKIVEGTIIEGTIVEGTIVENGAPPDDERGGEQMSASCSETPDGWSETIDDAAPEAPAPGGLANVVLPTDADAASALLDALPDELIGGTKAISARTQGDSVAEYAQPDRASPYGYRVADLPNSIWGGVLPEPRADMLVAFFVLSDDDDYIVEVAGHDGDLYWVTYTGTNSGYGIDGTEEVYSMTWGVACGRWAFSAGAPTEADRDELIAAFIVAAEEVATAPDPGPATP